MVDRIQLRIKGIVKRFDGGIFGWEVGQWCYAEMPSIIVPQYLFDILLFADLLADIAPQIFYDLIVLALGLFDLSHLRIKCGNLNWIISIRSRASQGHCFTVFELLRLI